MTTHGIDVSQYQGVIDWEIVQNRVDFAILRCGFGQDRTDQDDRLFKRNADECTRLEYRLVFTYIHMLKIVVMLEGKHNMFYV